MNYYFIFYLNKKGIQPWHNFKANFIALKYSLGLKSFSKESFPIKARLDKLILSITMSS